MDQEDAMLELLATVGVALIMLAGLSMAAEYLLRLLGRRGAGPRIGRVYYRPGQADAVLDRPAEGNRLWPTSGNE
jgi:hypothetical protein